jgi:hypothetical protein
MASLNRRKFQPAGYQYPQDMAVSEEDHVILDVLGPFNDPVAAFRNIFGSLPVGCGACEDGPFRIFLTDFPGCDALVIAIVPLGQIIGDLCAVQQSGQFTGSLSALPGAAENEFEIPIRQFRLQGVPA